MNQRSRAACFTTRRLVKGLVFAGVCVLLAGATIGFGPDMPTNTKGGEDGLPPPLRASTATLSAGGQPLGNTKQGKDGGETIVSTRKTTTKDDEEGDAGPDHGNWLWDTTLNNPRLHTPEFIPQNVRNLLSLSPSSSTPLSRTHFQQAVQGIRQCRNVGGGGKKNHRQQDDSKEGSVMSPFVLSLGEHLFKQYVEDLQRHKEDQGDDKKGPQQLRSRRRRPRLIYNCESNRMGRFCGGMGDRFRGMISTFYLSLLSDRRFELFHPVPVPLQRYLRPHLINWIPTKRREKEGKAGEEQLGQSDNGNNNKGSGSKVEEDKTASSAFDALLKELDTDPELSIPDSSMMRIKGHSVFLRKLDKLTSLLSGNVGKGISSATDLRIQTNSVGVDSFLMNQAKTPILSNRRQQLFQSSNNVGSSSSSLLPHTTVNLSTYFGCLYEVLFQPSAALLNNTAASLGPEIATITTAQPPNGANPSPHRMKKSISNKAILASSSSVTTYDSGSNGDGSRMELTVHQPFIGMQVRMGGSWAQGMLVKEPFRTSPEAVDDFFSLVQDVRSASEAVEITPPSTSRLRAKGPWPIFVSSDSERFVQETVAHFGSGNVRAVKGGFKHTDTLNFKEAKQSNNNKEGTTSAPVVVSSSSNGDKSVTTAGSSLTQQRRQEYLSTLTNHYILGMSNHIVMAQSGFGDTAFWRSRREASCIFVDMKSLKTAWQHHLSYQSSSLTTSQVGPNSVAGKPMIPPRLVPLSLVLASSNPEWTSKEEEEPLPVEELSVSQVRCSRTIDVAVKQSAFYSATCPSFLSSSSTTTK